MCAAKALERTHADLPSHDQRGHEQSVQFARLVFGRRLFKGGKFIIKDEAKN